jgi:hypothetical protein
MTMLTGKCFADPLNQWRRTRRHGLLLPQLVPILVGGAGERLHAVEART